MKLMRFFSPYNIYLTTLNFARFSTDLSADFCHAGQEDKPTAIRKT